MPTVTLDHEDLCQLLGRKVSLGKLKYTLPLIKCEVKSLIDNQITAEVTADRPDMFSQEGITRVLKGFLGIETGYPTYPMKQGRVSVKVTGHVEGIRPFIACAVIRNVSLTEAFIAQMMQLQEKLHETLCRRRRKGSIGVYDLDTVEPPLTYTACKPDVIRFTPLEESKPMTAKEILDSTAKGREYGSIIEGLPRYPLLTDSGGKVLSMPPVINSEDTKVTISTRNLLVDVTGLSEQLVNDVVNIMASNIAERSGCIECVKVAYPTRTVWTARLTSKKYRLNVDYFNGVSGLGLDVATVCSLARKMRLGARMEGKRAVEVTVPPYRCDIMHPVDLVEDIVIGYGYDHIKPELPRTPTYGKELSKNKPIKKVRDLMVGLGFQEVITYILTSEENQFKKMRLSHEEVVEVLNPRTSDFSATRVWLLPGLLNFLSSNTHVEYPQKIFERGDIVLADEQSETGTRSEVKLAAVVCDYRSSYESIQAVTYAVLHDMGISNWRIVGKNHPSFIPGRSASIEVDGKEVAILGEVHPEVLINFQVPNPVATFELNLSTMLK